MSKLFQIGLSCLIYRERLPLVGTVAPSIFFVKIFFHISKIRKGSASGKRCRSIQIRSTTFFLWHGTRVAEPCHFEAAPASAPAPEKPIFSTAPTYLLQAQVSWGRIKPAVLILINFTYFLHKVLSTYRHFLHTFYLLFLTFYRLKNSFKLGLEPEPQQIHGSGFGSR